MHAFMILAQNGGEDAAAGLCAGGCGCLFAIVYLAFLLIPIISAWKIFVKAGEPGWAALIPIYNIIIVLKIVDRPIWWLVLFLIPLVNFVAAVFICIDLAKKFGKDTLFGIGLLLLGIVFFPILAFGDAKYQGHGPIKEGFTL